MESLSRAIFAGGPIATRRRLPKQILARISYLALKWTTSRRIADAAMRGRAAHVLESHPLSAAGILYAQALMNSSVR